MPPLELLSIFAISSLRVGVAVWVALRAWQDRPARLYVALALLTLLGDGLTLLRLEATPQTSAALRTGSALWLCGLVTTFFLLYSSLFVPQWWEGRRPVRWIAAPYLVMGALLAADLLSRRGALLALVPGPGGLYDARPAPLLVAAFALGWVVQLLMLLWAFWRRPRDRLAVGGLILAMALGFWGGIAVNSTARERFAHPLYALLPSLPQHLLLAYLAVRTRLLEPTRAALDLALHAMSEAVAVLDRQGKVVYANPSARDLGLRPEVPAAQTLAAAGLPGPDTAPPAGEAPPQGQVVSLGGRRLHVGLTPVRGGRGEVRGTLFLGRDVTELEQRNAELSHLAGHDALTGLPNRRALVEALERAAGEARPGRTGVLMFLDLDGFKLVNDTLGHAAGDELLAEIGALLRSELRAADLVARLGGDEFAVLLQDQDLDRGRAVAARLLAAAAHHRFTRRGRTFRVGFSLGLTGMDGRERAHDLLAQADAAMYRAKAQGGHRSVVFSPGPGAAQPVGPAAGGARGGESA